MKTIIGSIALAASVAALAACHDETPARTPAQETTTTTSYQAAPQPQPQAQSTYTQAAPHETASSTNESVGNNDRYDPYRTNDVKPAPAQLDPSLTDNEPGASPKPVTGVAPTEPGPVNAKQPDKKSPAAAAVTDQGNSKSEVQISARIRKSMMASKTLSFGAKNVKVITSGQKVTLRGSVKTDAEKNEIAGIARNTNGVSEVDDQLVVKP